MKPCYDIIYLFINIFKFIIINYYIKLLSDVNKIINIKKLFVSRTNASPYIESLLSFRSIYLVNALFSHPHLFQR